MALPATDLPALLADLRRTKAILTPEELVHRGPRVVSSGLPALDELLGGGLPEGKTIGIAGPPGAGATALSFSVLSAFTATGGLAAVIDRGGHFDPASADAAGVSLERLLWCRPATTREAVKAADTLLASGAFPVVVLDLRIDEEAEVAPGRLRNPKGGANQSGGFSREARVRESSRPSAGAICGRASRREPEPPGAAWLRLSRTAESSRARLLVLGGAAGAGAFAVASLSCGRPTACFSGMGPGRTFEGLEVEVSLARNRLGLAPRVVRLTFRAPDHFSEVAPGGASGDPSSRGPRGTRVVGDPWVLPLGVSAASTPGELPKGRGAASPGERRVVPSDDPPGELRVDPAPQSGRRTVEDRLVPVEGLERRWAVVEGGR